MGDGGVGRSHWIGRRAAPDGRCMDRIVGIQGDRPMLGGHRLYVIAGGGDAGNFCRTGLIGNPVVSARAGTLRAASRHRECFPCDGDDA